MNRWLVTGGAGYIGSHLVDLLASSKIEVTVIDNLQNGNLEKIRGKCIFERIDIRDVNGVDNLFKINDFEGVINLAALKSVLDSQLFSETYKSVNEIGMQNLLNSAIKYGVKYFVQSSSAAVYGSSQTGIVNEDSPLMPISNYGLNKLNAENLLDSAINSGKIKGISLRYFNVVGAKNFKLRDLSTSNLFPIVKKNINEGIAPSIFGDNYDTPDGTCVRDYVHVVDIAKAHEVVLREIKERLLPTKLNIGTGKGYSVKEIVEAMLKCNNSELRPVILGRRPGDPAILVADNSKMRDYLKFRTKFELNDMVKTTY